MTNLVSTQNIQYAGYFFVIFGALIALFGNLQTGLIVAALGIIIVAVNK